MNVAFETRELSFAYPTGCRALADVNLRVAAGERIGIVGPNGAGKSTLLLCLAGVLPVEPNRIAVCGLDPANDGDRRRMPATVGLVFAISDDQLFHGTVEDDVAFGPLNLGLEASEVHRRVDRALAEVGLTGCEIRNPAQLSEGEKRRAALAGVLAMQPQCLLLDEPSMFLDPRGRRELRALLDRFDGTMVVATHDLEFLRQVCDRAVLLDGGKCIAQGAIDDLFADAPLMLAHGLEVPPSLEGRSRTAANGDSPPQRAPVRKTR